MMRKFIILFSTILISCSFSLDEELKDLRFKYVSTKNFGKNNIETIIQTNRDLHKIYKQHKLFVTYENLDCRISLKELGDVNDGRDKLSGKVRFKERSKEGFLYSIKYIALKDYSYISLNDYFNLKSISSNKLYCQYQVYFYGVKSFKSKIFEVPIEDFLIN